VLEPLMERMSLRMRGLTIVELMIVVAIIAVIVSLAAPSFKRTIEVQRLRGIHDQVITDLQFARSEAGRSGNYISFRMRAAGGGYGGCYIIFSDSSRDLSGPVCDCRLAAGLRCPVGQTVTQEIKTVQLESAYGVRFEVDPMTPRGRIAFDPVTGGTIVRPVDGGPIYVEGLNFTTTMDTGRALRGEVVVTGRPSTCAPAGSTIQVTACN
jgi:prepilin-type N-terminal cleavage/methylation domain-containing protein